MHTDGERTHCRGMFNHIWMDSGSLSLAACSPVLASPCPVLGEKNPKELRQKAAPPTAQLEFPCPGMLWQLYQQQQSSDGPQLMCV